MDDQEVSNRHGRGEGSPWSHADEQELRARAAAREERVRPAWLTWLDSRDAPVAPAAAGD